MDRWQRHTGYYLTILTLLMFGYAFAYQWGMIHLEGATGTSATFLHSLQVVVETFTTTGFGSDAPWHSSAMNVLVILMDTTGTLMIFLALPVFLFPALENAFETSVPDAVEDDYSDHVVIATYSPRAQSLVEELEARDVEYILVEPDGDRAIDLYEDGYEVIEANPEDIEGLRCANLAQARSLVVDVSDRVDTSIVLAAREISEGVRVVSVVEDPGTRSYHELAGADEVLSPRRLLGERLAGVASTAVVTDLGDAIEIGDEFEIAELLVHQGSPLAGVRLAESNLREQRDVNVIGAWFQDEFESPVSPDTVLEAGTVLLVTGKEGKLNSLETLPKSTVREFESGETLVLGHGEVGQTITQIFDEEGQRYTTLDVEDKPGVDVVGEAYDTDALEAMGIDAAQSAILAIPDDTDAEYATLVMRNMTNDLDIAARTQEEDSVQKMYRAGANYVLSLATVTGQMTASAVLDDDEISMVDSHIALLKTAVPTLTGQTLVEAQIRERTNCTVIAVERDDSVLTSVAPDFRIESGDELIVAGPKDAVSNFSEAVSE